MTVEISLNISRERMNYLVNGARALVIHLEKKLGVYFTPYRIHKFQAFKRHKYKKGKFLIFRRKCKRKQENTVGYLYDLSIETEYLNRA